MFIVSLKEPTFSFVSLDFITIKNYFKLLSIDVPTSFIESFHLCVIVQEKEVKLKESKGLYLGSQLKFGKHRFWNTQKSVLAPVGKAGVHMKKKEGAIT